MPEQSLRPGLALGAYPESGHEPAGVLESAWQATLAPAVRRRGTGLSDARSFVQRVEAAGRNLKRLDERQLLELTHAVSRRLRNEGLVDDACASAFAIVREASSRVLGMRHYDSQVTGGWAILQGMLAEMETGEGKTLTASLPACTAALAGIPVHVITVNDYLATRDRDILAPLYAMLGLSAGVVTGDMQDVEARRRAYACDITYCTNKQIAFDYLRDRVAIGDRQGAAYRAVDRLAQVKSGRSGLLLRGLCFAIVDEADSVLIDEARTPLKLSGTAEDSLDETVYRQALEIAQALSAMRDTFRVDGSARTIQFTERGKRELAALTARFGGTWSSARRREGLVRQALSALHLYVRDRDYLVRDEAVQIIDQNTGRVMPDRSWEMGLHQLIELKEDIELSKPTTSVAQITYQRFFRRYLRLGAMSGTAAEVSAELWRVYGLRVVSVPSHRPLRRQSLGTRVFASEDDKFSSIVSSARDLHRQGRPVLIGTRTVAASEKLSELLTAAGLDHQVLNAKQDSDEADIVGRAGSAGCITIATNMAGRGTDIALTPDTEATGGLHVIAAEQNEARRIDRQLYGRCGRQGDPGSYETLIALDDEILQKCAPRPVKKLSRSILCQKDHMRRLVGVLMMRLAQNRLEKQHNRARRQLLKRDERLSDLLAFGGSPE